MIGSVVLVAIIASSLAYGIGLNKNVKAWENKVYPGVNVYGVEIGGLTKEEAIKSLNEKLSVNIMDKTLAVTAGEQKFDLKYSDLNLSYDVEAIATDAVKYGKDGSNFSKNTKIKKGKDHNIEGEISYDEGKLKEFEDTVKSTVDVEPKDAKISTNSGNIVIIPEVVGNKIDGEDLHNKLVENINKNLSNKVELTFELKESKARLTKDDLSQIDSKLSSYSNSYRMTGDGRVRNMEIAAQTVSGIVLMPGDEFSYNDLIGDTTPDKGYEKANTYVGNKIVPDYGGGICQVSTTLYRAVMKANIRSTERRNHSLMVGYSEAGLDATVAYGFVDYKFKNTYDFPIYIEGAVGGGTVGFSIYGNKSKFGEKTYELVNEVLETYKPGNEYVDDPTLEIGKEVIQSYGMTGYKASSYQVTYENGTEVNREIVATDVYGTTKSVVKRGTKKPANTPPPANVATPTPVPTPVPAPKVAQ
ncbi:VanW family protein [Clostridium gasigenes]|nr:VanW family protein [Clostridium gasigenes]MBU3088347.1 VanW family protein [Clostridium gasigenes]